MRKRAGPYKELHQEEQDKALPIRSLNSQDCIVPDTKYDYSHENLVRQLCQNLRDEKRLPGIRLGRPLSDFVQFSIRDELWHNLGYFISNFSEAKVSVKIHLVDQRWEDGCLHENRKHRVLDALNRAVGAIECETNESIARSANGIILEIIPS